MKILDKIRNQSFWFIDYLKGGKIKSHYDDVKFILENTSTIESKQKQAVHLTNILNHAVNTTQFYKNQKDFYSIEDFPITNKNQIRDNFNKFESSRFLNKKKRKVSTSGSTAAPFQIFHNRDKSSRHIADTIFFGEKGGFRFGQELIYIRIWPKKYERSLIRNFHKVSVFAFEDSDIEKLLNRIKNSKTKVAMLGYASSFEKICNYMDKTGRSPFLDKVSSVISMSERLNSYTKNSVKKHLNQVIVSRYSNTEQGIIAQEELNNEGRFKINVASFFVEIMDMEADIHANKGSYGRIVVTDLFNYSVPLIRYDTGDIAKIEEYKNEDGLKETYLTKIEGRKNDLIYNTNGEIVPSQISYLMTKYGSFKQYQFVQSGKKEYRLKLNTDIKVTNEEGLINEYKSVLGTDANVMIEYVDGIPLLGSGKKKEVLNTYMNSV